MSLQFEATTTGGAWLHLLNHLARSPDFKVGPRGLGTQEIIDVSFQVCRPTHNIFVHPARNLQYRFMIAEWLWIWFGREDVESISRYNKHIAQFSDDGEIFTGAYGPRIKTQLPRVIETLHRDPSSRQAVIYIFDGIKRTKDVPCTLTIQFLIREDHLHTIVNMRSSDVWLGLPYDMFNFSMISNILGAYFSVKLGSLVMHLGSSHLYDKNLDQANKVLRNRMLGYVQSPVLSFSPPTWLEHVLCGGQSGFLLTSHEPWLTYARVLQASSNAEALELLQCLSDSLTTNTFSNF